MLDYSQWHLHISVGFGTVLQFLLRRDNSLTSIMSFTMEDFTALCTILGLIQRPLKSMGASPLVSMSVHLGPRIDI